MWPTPFSSSPTGPGHEGDLNSVAGWGFLYSETIDEAMDRAADGSLQPGLRSEARRIFRRASGGQQDLFDRHPIAFAGELIFKETAMLTRLLSLAIATTLLAGCAHSAPDEKAPFRAVYYRSNYAVKFDVAYGEHERHRMDMYLRGQWHAPGPRMNVRMKDPQPPTIVFSYGSSWFFGDKRTWEHFISPFLQRGYNVINLNYRVKKGIPKAVSDVRQALVHLAENNDRYGLDLNRVVLVGASAGGHMWSLLGAANNSDKKKFQLPKTLGIAAVVSIAGGGARCGGIYHLLKKHKVKFWRDVAASLVEDISQVDAILEEHCPIRYLSPGDPPMFLPTAKRTSSSPRS